MNPGNNTHGNIVLVGPMGAGKSAVGRRLAAMLGMAFCDSDSEIEDRTGVDIGFIFEKEGEAGFRKRESEVLAELSAQTGVVLATGGGAILDPETRRLLADCGQVIYLRASVEQQLERTRHARHRPLLESENPRAVLEQLLAIRDPLYREVAHYCVNTDRRRVEAVAREVHQWLSGTHKPKEDSG